MIDRYQYLWGVECVVGVRVVDPVAGTILSSLTNWSFPITIYSFPDLTVKELIPIATLSNHDRAIKFSESVSKPP